MKKLFLLVAMLVSAPAMAHDGSWFGLGGGYDHFASGGGADGYSVTAEGGYWYLGNVAYGGAFKGTFINPDFGGDFKIYDVGAFWKAGTDAGLYGKVIAGLAFIDGNYGGFRDSSKSFYLGAGGGFLFPISESFQVGPEVLYRHLTAGNGADQITVSALVTYGF
ncbi:MAG: hypothetical protein EOP11_05075 [Proteobacteria bacterium]|nr:MAG: hypothetical protein EOP11_05075 [Pseudomonadota bacterium]